MQTITPRILGAVLAGGRARRFGSDKALALLDDRPLIAHVLAALTAQTEAVIICGRTWEDGTAVPDRPQPDLGPLGGLNAALHHAIDHGYDAVLTAGCDTPDLPADLLAHLDHYPRPSLLASMPIIGLWPTRLAPVLDRHLGSQADRSVKRWGRIVEAIEIDLPMPLANINTPADLTRLRGS